MNWKETISTSFTNIAQFLYSKIMKNNNTLSRLLIQVIYTIAFVLLLFAPKYSFGQLNLDSLSHINYQQLHEADLNDVWGYVDEMGMNMHLLGLQKELRL